MKPHLYSASLLSAIILLLTGALPGIAQTGTANEPVRYIGNPSVQSWAHDGELRPAVGAESFQVMRANRTHPESSDGFGWTYNHAAMIVYWNGRFLVEYLSNPVGEHIAPGQTFLCSSTDGRNWEFPKVAFPIYNLQPPDPKGTAMMHQRMGFFIAPDGRLLLLAFYGHAPNPFRQGGIGRVVREMYKDGTFGPVYFIRYNSRYGWGESNTGFPFYKHSPDKDFVKACDAMLANRLMREQWWDEERLDDKIFAAPTPAKKGTVNPDADEEKADDPFFSVRAPGSHEAFNWYRRKDGKLVGLWKWSLAALSEDEGKTWSPPVKCPTLQMTGAKITGRRTSNGRYALVYNPNVDDDHRWPLAIVTSEDGIMFDNMLHVQGEVPPRRFAGRYKDFGSQYNRAVEEGNGSTPGPDLWVCYSMNKEDIWVTRIPVPVRHSVSGAVEDTFDNLEPSGPVTNWNIYSPRWAPVRVVNFPSSTNRSLELSDKDPYDYARAIRVFPETKKAKLSFKVHANQNDTGRLEIDVTDRFGYQPVRLLFAEDGQIKATNGGKEVTLAPYQKDKWYDFGVDVDVANGRFDVSLDGRVVLSSATFAEFVRSVERISFRTGPKRTEPTLRTSTDNTPDRKSPNPDVPVPVATYHVDDVRITATQ